VAGSEGRWDRMEKLRILFCADGQPSDVRGILLGMRRSRPISADAHTVLDGLRGWHLRLSTHLQGSSWCGRCCVWCADLMLGTADVAGEALRDLCFCANFDGYHGR